MQDNISRLERLEKKLARDRLTVLAVDQETGEEITESVSDMIDNGHGFKKVIDGTDMTDLSRCIDYFIYLCGVDKPADGFITQEFRDKARERAARSRKTEPVENYIKKLTTERITKQWQVIQKNYMKH